MRVLPMMVLLGCNPEPEETFADRDGDGFTTQYDCDDAAAAVFPTADELCDGIDNDCDDQVDESDAVDAVVVYVDADFDGYGNDASTTTACDPPPGYIAVSGDCDDADDTTHPGAPELCDGADNDCNDVIDDDPIDATTWRPDSDGDGYGTGEGVEGCSPGSGYVSAEQTDCDDTDPAVLPGALELCRDGRVNSCDTTEAEALAACAWGGSISESSAYALTATEGNAGWSAVAADLTGDGLDDLIVGLPGTAHARLVDGPVAAGGALSGLGASLYGTTGSAAGAALAAGDLDGDGYTDLIVGGPGSSSVWLLAGPVTATSGLGTAAVREGSWLGTAVAAGDVDGDGLHEAILGDPDQGVVLIVDSEGVQEASLTGGSAGAVLAGAGDVNGDGIDDVLVGAPGKQTGWLVLGPISGAVVLADAVTFTGGNYSRAGSALAAADFDGDGYTDPVIGAPIDGFYTGLIGVFPGGPSPAGGALSDAPLTIEGELGMLVGGNVSPLPDLDLDGLPELVVGSGYAVTEGGQLEINDGPAEAYLFRSSALSSLSGSLSSSSAATTFEGPQRPFGLQVTGLPDVTGDGWSDVFISSGESDEECYLFPGPGF